MVPARAFFYLEESLSVHTGITAAGGLPTLVFEKSICEWLGLSRQAVSKLVQKGTFPAPVRIGARRKAWVICEIADWLESRRGAAPDSKIVV